MLQRSPTVKTVGLKTRLRQRNKRVTGTYSETKWLAPGSTKWSRPPHGSLGLRSGSYLDGRRFDVSIAEFEPGDLERILDDFSDGDR